MTLNRMSGLVVAVLGAVLLFWIIPYHTETVDYGWLRPATLPIVTAVVVLLSSIVHIVFPTETAEFNTGLALRAGLFFVISLAGLFLMHVVGFGIAAPLLVMVIMILVGERRPFWLIAGVVMIPLAIWGSIELLLNRPLP